MYIGDWMGRGAQYWPDNIAVVDAAKLDAEQPKQGRFTYAEMNRRAEAVAGWLQAQGLGHGDRVAVVALNGVEVLDIFFACGKLGAIFVPFNWRLHPAELADLVVQTTPAALFFSDEFAQSIAAIQPDCPSITSYVHLEGPGLPNQRTFPNHSRRTNHDSHSQSQHPKRTSSPSSSPAAPRDCPKRPRSAIA